MFLPGIAYFLFDFLKQLPNPLDLHGAPLLTELDDMEIGLFGHAELHAYGDVGYTSAMAVRIVA